MSKSITKLTPRDILNTSTRQLITAPPSITVRRALQLLAKEQIPSLPITSHDGSGRVVNIVNTFDILDYVVGFADDVQRPGDLQRRADAKLDGPIESVMTLDSDRESYRVFTMGFDDPLELAIRAFGTGKYHRVLVKAHDGAPARIISQADLFAYIQENPGCACQDLDMPMETYGLGEEVNVVKIQVDESALMGFHRLDKHGITSAPVVDEQGKVVGNLRAYDARQVVITQLDDLELPVLEFLQKTQEGVRPPVTVEKGCTVTEVIRRIVSAKAHHVWVLGEKDGATTTVIGVVSLTDLCHHVLLHGDKA